MKISCEYCDNKFDDVLATCPHCGAPNAGVVRTNRSQPVTIEELKQWYSSKGLPPYETTRFFIGENYRGRRAFGIYKDEKGIVTVYKNKDDGTRAVRYKGTDEAYAVNEIFQRLKQEIIQQKGRQRSDRSRQAAPSSRPVKQERRRPSGCLIGLLVPVALFALIFVDALFSIIVENAPKKGYYDYEGAAYYYYENPDQYSDRDWFLYSDGDWSGAVTGDRVPQELKKNKNAKSYYLTEDWSTALGVPNFMDSDSYERRKIAYLDAKNGRAVDTGYYRHSDRTYYHAEKERDEGWYVYDSRDKDWYGVDSDKVPYELRSGSLAEDFFYVPVWDASTQISDFCDSSAYNAFMEQSGRDSFGIADYLFSGDSDEHWDNDDDYDYDWGSDDDWDSGSSDWSSDW